MREAAHWLNGEFGDPCLPRIDAITLPYILNHYQYCTLLIIIWNLVPSILIILIRVAKQPCYFFIPNRR